MSGQIVTLPTLEAAINVLRPIAAQLADANPGRNIYIDETNAAIKIVDEVDLSVHMLYSAALAPGGYTIVQLFDPKP